MVPIAHSCDAAVAVVPCACASRTARSANEEVVQNKCKDIKSWGIKQKLLSLHAVSQLPALHACLPDFRRLSSRLEHSRRIASTDSICLSEQRPLNCDRSTHQPWCIGPSEDGRWSTLSWWSLCTTPLPAPRPRPLSAGARGGSCRHCRSGWSDG